MGGDLAAVPELLHLSGSPIWTSCFLQTQAVTHQDSPAPSPGKQLKKFGVQTKKGKERGLQGVVLSGQWGCILSWDLMTLTDVCLPHRLMGWGRGDSQTSQNLVFRERYPKYHHSSPAPGHAETSWG